ncbi:MAG TPA: hypothetical protein VFM58_16280 [Solirubrobacteraceae bacterium]|nr:hypothetical protein [Solirubrobacteraceae bacterium]
MPVVDRRDFGGRFPVSENSKRLPADAQDELVRRGRAAVARIEGFHAGDGHAGADDAKFTFQKDGGQDPRPSMVIGE